MTAPPASETPKIFLRVPQRPLRLRGKLFFLISVFSFPNFSFSKNGPPVTDANRRMAEHVSC